MNPQKFYSSSLFPDPSIPTTNNYKRKNRHESNRDDEILAYGYESKIYNDKSIAIRVEEGKYLIPWKSSNVNMLMDRYDVRHLIEDQDLFLVDQTAMLEIKYNTERYADLEYDNNENSSYQSRNKAAIPYDYDGDNKKIKITNEEPIVSEIEKEIMIKYKTPKSMIVPATKEQIAIIEATSKQVGSAPNSNLLEIRIQVKNANNSLYSFLNKQDILYPFYKHIGSLPTTTSSSSLVAYSDSESEDDEQDQVVEPPLEIKQVITKTAEFIAKSTSSHLEQHIRSKKGNDPKFSFLNTGNVYHNYFKSQIERNKQQINYRAD